MGRRLRVGWFSPAEGRAVGGYETAGAPES